jgi:hypothetical protein
MATRTKKADPFKAFRPRSEEVAIGEHSLILKTATLDQESRFLEIVETLELNRLIGPIAELIQEAQDSDGTGLFIQRLASAGPQLWEAARVVLGKQFAPAVQAGCLALLDSEHNLNRLVDSGALPESDTTVGPDGEYLGCSAVRRFIKAELTLIQGVKVIQSAWDLNGYGDLLGNLMAPVGAALQE